MKMKTTKLRSFLKRIVCVLAAACLIAAAFPIGVCASDPLTNYLEGWPQMTDINEDSACLIDADNLGVMYSLNRDEKMYPASITKIMTALVVLDNANLMDKVTMDDNGTSLAVAGYTNASTVNGEEFTVEQCLYMMLLQSANDIAQQLAVSVAGSVDAFADMMNEKAKEIGCTGTHFTNPTGLPDENHYTTAMDMARIMAVCLRNSEFRTIISTASYTVPATNKTKKERTYKNHCRLIDSGSEYYYQYCIGGKTGFTDEAERTLICAAEKDGRTLVGVTLHGADKSDFTDMASLFDYGFNNFSKQTLDDGTTVNLPDGIDVSSLTRNENDLDDGTAVVTYNYGDLPVGGSDLNVQVLATGGSTDGDAQSASGTGSSAASTAAGTESAASSTGSALSSLNSSGKSLNALPIILVLLIILNLGLFVLTFMSSRQHLRREQNQRRKAEKAARAERENARRQAEERQRQETRRPQNTQTMGNQDTQPYLWQSNWREQLDNQNQNQNNQNRGNGGRPNNRQGDSRNRR